MSSFEAGIRYELDDNVARVTIDNVASAENMGVDVVIVDDALRRLEELAPRQARIIELRCLVGLSLAETAEVIGVSQRTVSSEWRLARAWIVRALQGEQTRTR